MNDILRVIARYLVLLVAVLLAINTLAGLAGCTGDATTAARQTGGLTQADCDQHPQACT